MTTEFGLRKFGQRTSVIAMSSIAITKLAGFALLLLWIALALLILWLGDRYNKLDRIRHHCCPRCGSANCYLGATGVDEKGQWITASCDDCGWIGTGHSAEELIHGCD